MGHEDLARQVEALRELSAKLSDDSARLRAVSARARARAAATRDVRVREQLPGGS